MEAALLRDYTGTCSILCSVESLNLNNKYSRREEEYK